MKEAHTAPPTPKPAVQQFENYEYSKGACRGGDQSENNAGLKFYGDDKCKDRCDEDQNCTGFNYPPGPGKPTWCETYTSVGAVGDGRNFRCYMKLDFKPYNPFKKDGYNYSKGACRGGRSPNNNAGLQLFTKGENCMEMCNKNPRCTGVTYPMSGYSWCETYTSVGARGDGRSFRCFMKDGTLPPTPPPVPTPGPTIPPIDGYVASKGACRGGKTPGFNAGLKFYRDNNCLKRCNDDPKCTGYNIPMEEPTWCETYTSVGAKGDGRGFWCYMKKDYSPGGDTKPPTNAPEPSPCKDAQRKKDCTELEQCEYVTIKNDDGKKVGICQDKKVIEKFDSFDEFMGWCEGMEADIGMSKACTMCQGKFKNKKGKSKCTYPKNASKVRCKKVKKNNDLCLMLGCELKKGVKCTNQPRAIKGK